MNFFKSLFFKFARVLFFSLEVNIMVFVISSEVFLVVSGAGSNTVFYSYEKFVHSICLVSLTLSFDFVTRLSRSNFLNLLYF